MIVDDIDCVTLFKFLSPYIVKHKSNKQTDGFVKIVCRM